MAKIYPRRRPQQRQAPGRLSSPVSSSTFSSSSENRSQGSVSTQATTTSSHSLIKYQFKYQQKASSNVTSVSNKQQRNSIGRQQGEAAAPSSRPEQAQKTSSPQTPRDARPSASSKSDHSTEDVKPGPSNDAAAFVAIATGPSDERLNLFNNFRVECEYFTNTAERKIEELRHQNKDLQARNFQLQEEKEHAIAKETGERSRNEDLEKELSNTKEEKQRALNELKQERDTTATLLKNQKQAHELLIAMIRQNSCARRRLKKSKRNMQSALKELIQKAETTTRLQSMVTDITKTCEDHQVRFKSLQMTANRERREADNTHFRLLNERRKAETANGHLREDLKSSQTEIDSLKEEKLSQEKSSKEQKRKFEKDLNDYLSINQSRRDEISTLKSENETLSKEKQDITARNVFLQRKAHRISVRLRTTRRLLTDETATSRKFRNQKKALCTALDQAKEEQTKLTIANRDLETLIPTLRKDIKDIKDLKDRIIVLYLALLDAEQQPSTSQDSSGATARPNNSRSQERNIKRQLGQFREGGRTHIGEWRSWVELKKVPLRTRF